MKENNSSISVQEYKRKSITSRILMAVSVISGIVPIFIVINMVRLLTNKEITKESILMYGGIIFLCQILKAVFYGLSLWKAHEYAYNALSEIRLKIISHLKKLPFSFFQKRKIGDLTNIINHDVDRVELYLAHGLPDITIATFIPIFIAVGLLIYDWRLGLALVSTVPLMLIYQVFLTKLIASDINKYHKSTSEMSENLLEYIGTIPVVKAFSKDENRTKTLLQHMHDYITWVGQMTKNISGPMTVPIILIECGLIVMTIIGSRLLISQKVELNVFILAIILGGIFINTIGKYATYHHFVIIFQKSVNSINTILGVETIDKKETNEILQSGDIEFKDIKFSYEKDKTVLEDVNLTIKKNTMNAVVGISGSGKTTIANLLMGFWKPDSGVISINGKNINDLSEKDLSKLVSIVQQEAFLFNMSIEDNIRIGNNDATKDQIIEAAKKAQIHDMIMSLPKGYETKVGEAGAKLSGGEKQRLSIARMILKNAPIIILDEATSAIDTYNEFLIQKAIDNLGKNKTIITIAHHLNTITNSDQIVVMDSGKVIAKGTHQELLDDCKLYREMVKEQSNVDNWKIKEVAS